MEEIVYLFKQFSINTLLQEIMFIYNLLYKLHLNVVKNHYSQHFYIESYNKVIM